MELAASGLEPDPRGGPAIAPSMLLPLLAMILGFYCYFAAVLLVRTRAEILRRERNAQWIAQELAADGTRPAGTSSGPLASRSGNPLTTGS